MPNFAELYAKEGHAKMVLMEENSRLKARLAEAERLLLLAKDATYNGFEPDNQCKTYYLIAGYFTARAADK